MVPRPGQQVSEKELNSDPSTIAANMIAEVTSETLAPAHAIEKGLLHKLCKHGLDKMLASLLEIQKKFTSGVNAKYRGKTPLHYLAKGASVALQIEPFLEIAQLMHKHGADFNIKDSKGCTPIHYLITDGNVSYRMVNTFIECGAHVDGTEGANPEGYNALGLAVSRASNQVIQLLLNAVKIDDAGLFMGNVITQDVLIHLAVMTEQISVVKTVLLACPKTNVNVGNRCKVTPLHAIVATDQDWTNLAQFGKPKKKAGYSYEIVNYLLDRYLADPNLKDEEGKTPLHYACANGHRTSTVCLLNHGAKTSLKDNYGRYPEDYCRDRLKSPSSAVQWHMQALKERIHAGYKVVSVEMLTDRVEMHYNEILKELRKHKERELEKAAEIAKEYPSTLGAN